VLQKYRTNKNAFEQLINAGHEHCDFSDFRDLRDFRDFRDFRDSQSDLRNDYRLDRDSRLV
jgi:hypothetical protein